MKPFSIALGAIMASSPGLCCASQACDSAASQVRILSADNQTASLAFQTEAIRNGWVTETSKAAIDQKFQSASDSIQSAPKKGCKSGDVLVLPKAEGWLIRKLCDFGKTVVRCRHTVTCVIR